MSCILVECNGLSVADLRSLGRDASVSCVEKEFYMAHIHSFSTSCCHSFLIRVE